MKLVSIIIPTFNRATMVHKAIKSVLSQTYSNIEVIVVDDGSEDITPEVISAISDKKVKYIRFENNQGISAARNRGITEAKGDFIGFLDSDDEFLPEKVAKQVSLLEKVSKDVGMVFTNYTEIGKKKNLVVGEYVPSGYITDENSFPATIAAAPSSWLLRRSALKK